MLHSFANFALAIRRLQEELPAKDVHMWALIDCTPVEAYTRCNTALLGDVAFL